MVKVGIITNTLTLSRDLGIGIISKGFFADHIFLSKVFEDTQEEFVKGFDILIFDYENSRKFLDETKILEKLNHLVSMNSNFIILISGSPIQVIRKLYSIGIKNFVNLELSIQDLIERTYEIISSFRIPDTDRRKHVRVHPPENSEATIIINNSISLKGNIFDISAGGVSVIFRKEEDINMMIEMKAYNSILDLKFFKVDPKLFLVRREGLKAGFKFYNIDDRELWKISSYIYHVIVEDTYSSSNLLRVLNRSD